MKTKFQKLISRPYLLVDFVDRNVHLIPYSFSDGRYSLNPLSIGISVNSVCNLKCVMCDVGQNQENSQYYEKLSKRSDMDLDVIKNVIRDFKSFKPLININSTEPLLYNDLLELLKFIKNNGLTCSVTTNGYLLEKFANDFVEVGLDRLSVSIDGPEEIHDKIRGVKGCFKRAVKGIEKINHYKDMNNVNSPRILVNATISQYNIGYLLEFTDFIFNLKVNHLQFGHLNFITDKMAEKHNAEYEHICHINSSSLSSIDLSNFDLNELITEIDLIRSKYPLSFCSFYPYIHGEEVNTYYKKHHLFIRDNKCFKPWLNAQILSDGTVVSGARCAFNIRLGNINDDKFTDIWNGKEFKNFRSNLKKAGATPACTRCCGIF